MPTVMKLNNGARVVIYPNDHRPPHVHVLSAGLSAVIHLNLPEGPPTLHENRGFSLTEIRQIIFDINNELTLLCEKWKEIHGYV